MAIVIRAVQLYGWYVVTVLAGGSVVLLLGYVGVALRDSWKRL
jgi:hypothetical protein